MAQRSIRFPDDVAAAVEAEATALDRSFSYVVIDALRCYLRVPAAVASVPVDSIPPREPSRAELEALDADLLAGEPVATYGCPVSGCMFMSSSPAAICGRHGRKVKPPKGGKG